MPREHNSLSAKSLPTKLKTAGKYCDGRNLYLYVKPNGTASWIFRYRDRITGKNRDKGLGSYATVSLMRARQKAGEYREMLDSKKDPIQTAKDELSAKKVAKAKLLTFKQCFDRLYNSKSAGWRNIKHGKQWTSTVENHCKDILEMPVSEVNTEVVFNTLEPIWLKTAVTAQRVRQRIEAVISWAKSHDFYSGENPARLKGHLDNLLPKQPSIVKHRVAVPLSDMAEFMAKLEKLNTASAIALKLMILAASRPNEATQAKWSEFDLKLALWTIPPERMKANRKHVVPLSPKLVKIISGMKRKADAEFLFPGRKGKSLTTAAVLKLVKELYPSKADITAHGFRSTFRDWAGSISSHPRDTIEFALAHVIQNKAEAAYARDTHVDKRRLLMADWADYCYTKFTPKLIMQP